MAYSIKTKKGIIIEDEAAKQIFEFLIAKNIQLNHINLQARNSHFRSSLQFFELTVFKKCCDISDSIVGQLCQYLKTNNSLIELILSVINSIKNNSTVTILIRERTGKQNNRRRPTLSVGRPQRQSLLDKIGLAGELLVFSISNDVKK